jgi:hypothetical protein
MQSWVRARPCKLQKRCTRLAAASDKVYSQLLAHWSVVLSGYSGFSTTKTGRHYIAEMLLKVALSTEKSTTCQFYDIYRGSQLY